MNRRFTIYLFRPDGSPITKKQLEGLKPETRLNYLIESPLPLYGYFSQGKNLRNLFINNKKQISGFLLVGCPAPNANHITVAEFDGGLINGFEVALTHFDNRTELVVYPAWQGSFSGKREKIQIHGLSFEPLVRGLAEFIFRNFSHIPAEKRKTTFTPYGTQCPTNIGGGEVFIQRFKPHTGFGTGLIKIKEKEVKVMLDWKRMPDIFSIKEGTIVPATIIKLDNPTKYGIAYTAIIGDSTASKRKKTPVQTKLGEIFDLSSRLKGKLAS